MLETLENLVRDRLHSEAVYATFGANSSNNKVSCNIRILFYGEKCRILSYILLVVSRDCEFPSMLKSRYMEFELYLVGGEKQIRTWYGCFEIWPELV